MTRVLALDHGTARCGCALSDPTGTLARPLDIVERPDSTSGLTEIARLVREERVERVVVGLPVSLDGTEREQAEAARGFAARLAEHCDVPVELHDERFTTRLANQTSGRAAPDSRAAAHLLMSYLASRAAGRPPAG